MSEGTGYSGPSAYQIASEVRSQLQSELNAIQNNISITNNNVQIVSSRVDEVDDKVLVIYREMLAFIREQRMANRLNQAETRIGTIRQELEKKYGHYDNIRRTVIGILEADDLALVRQSTIATASENLFISTPHYWLAPCLVALAAWICDNEDLCKKAVKEALKRNAENASLFFALVTRRADRFQPSLLWIQRYLADQNEESLNRNAMVVLEALVCGIWGYDTEGLISEQFKTWIQKLESKENFYETQVSNWKTSFLSKRTSLDSQFSYLQKYSKEWQTLEENLVCASLHTQAYQYVKNIFDTPVHLPDFKVLLDEALTKLVTDYDDEELPLREKERLETLVIQYNGDEDKAKSLMNAEKSLFDKHKNFMQLLLEAAMNPEANDTNVALTKFAIAVSKYYIYDAYNDITAENRAKIPEKISGAFEQKEISSSYKYNTTFSGEKIESKSFDVSEFQFVTKDGSNELKIIELLKEKRMQDLQKALAQAQKAQSDEAADITKNIILGIIGLFFIVGIPLLIIAVPQKIRLNEKYQFYFNDLKKQFSNLVTNESQTIRAFCAETVDYRDEFAEKDAKAQIFLDYIENLEGNEYIHVPASRRRVIT